MNFGTPVPLIVGVILIVGAIALFFLDKIKPGYRRDSDNIYAFLGLLAGVILLAHLGMEFTLSLQQMIMVGMLVALMIENIQNRLPNNGPMRQPRERGYRERDDEYRSRRPQRSNRTRSEAQLEFDDDMPSRPRRIRGERERRGRDEYTYGDSYNDDASYQRSRRRAAAYDDYEQSSYSQDSYGYDQSRSSSTSYAPPETSTERPRRRRPLQLTGELEDKDYTPDDYSSAVKAMRNRRRKDTGDDADGYSTNDYSGDNNGSDTYGQNGNDDYVDYKPLDLPKYPGPSAGGPESDDGSY
ncbi:Ycf66 family protein [Acaryochloris sp. IP29b_bin.137]|uniref:Ycf66 family protein n=1 Tax=Acaryochloris sp. IP29b_bin.137 TaxID=2969217 RepID=UPI00262C1031|nr:Ycf66 family protein [Acaryochloris sp. IP29b_bin.137]